MEIDMYCTDFVGKAIFRGNNIVNPYDYTASAYIKFVFEDIDKGNYWISKNILAKSMPSQMLELTDHILLKMLASFSSHVLNHFFFNKNEDIKEIYL